MSDPMRLRLSQRLSQEAGRLIGWLPGLLRTARLGTSFRRVVYTGPRMQVVAMSLPAGSEIGWERHDYVEQLFIVLRGKGRIRYVGGGGVEVEPGDVAVVPPGIAHNVLAHPGKPLNLLTVYSPPNHLPDTVHRDRQEAQEDIEDEEFGKGVR